MNFNKLQTKQAELDAYIGQSKNINMADYKLERIIALQVEFNELLNELHFLFKYWSNKRMNRDKALEEYVDGLHFLASIANDLQVTGYRYTKPGEYDMRILALGIANMITHLPTTKNFKQLADHFLYFGEKLGFTDKQILEAYERKYKINIERQKNSY